VADSRVHVLQGKNIPEYAVVYRVHGPFLFGATDKFADILEELDTLPPIVILRLRNITAIDATGLGAIRELADRLHASGRQLLLCGAREQPAQLMKQAEFARHVGAQNICPSITAALVEPQICTTRRPNLCQRLLPSNCCQDAGPFRAEKNVRYAATVAEA